MAVATEDTAHITRMVSLQKKSKKSSKTVKIFTMTNTFCDYESFATSSCKGLLRTAPVGKGIIDDAIWIQRNAIPVVVPPMSFHHKPSAALYGNTAPLKKSAGPVNVPHKPFAGGDGHLGRKIAVHVAKPTHGPEPRGPAYSYSQNAIFTPGVGDQTPGGSGVSQEPLSICGR